ncbi:hypothetical protein BMS3Bbin08_01407 [bacterium BMS3Bbin08]|nr:hypothetical protein BMS3Bbin08_01407 [bacterium BMS3Bbin08]
MFRIIILIVDFLFLGFVIAMTIIEFPHGSPEILALVFVYLLVISNIVCIYFSKTEKETWISLFFKRKRLEEKKKIEELDKK